MPLEIVVHEPGAYGAEYSRDRIVPVVRDVKIAGRVDRQRNRLALTADDRRRRARVRRGVFGHGIRALIRNEEIRRQSRRSILAR